MAFLFVAANSGFADLKITLATGKLLGFAPLVEVRHPDGTVNFYRISGAASNTTRAAVLTAAMTAAASGDAVIAHAGTYNGQLQTKVGVAVYFGAAAVMDYTGSGSTVLEPVSGGEVEILGHGSFYKTGSQSTQHVFSIVKAATDMRVEAEIVECHPSSVSTDGSLISTIKIVGENEGDDSSIGGKLSLNCHYVEGDGCTAIYHIGGWYYITANEIKSSGAGVSTIRMPGLALTPDSVTDGFSISWIDTKKLRSDPTERVLFIDGNQNHEAIIYIESPQIAGCIESSPSGGLTEVYVKNQLFIPSYESGAIGSTGGRYLLKIAGSAANVFQITADNLTTAGTNPAVLISNLFSGSKILLGGIFCESGLPLEFSGAALTNPAVIGQINTTNARAVKMTSGTGWIKGCTIITQATTSNGLEIASGTLRVDDSHIDTTAGTSANPVTKSGGTLILSNCTLLANIGRDSITAGSAQNVKIYNTCVTNRAKNANITLQVGTLIVDTNVQ